MTQSDEYSYNLKVIEAANRVQRVKSGEPQNLVYDECVGYDDIYFAFRADKELLCKAMLKIVEGWK